VLADVAFVLAGVAVRLRIPAWVSAPVVKINGAKIAQAVATPCLCG
jgi:hypothetical protein